MGKIKSHAGITKDKMSTNNAFFCLVIVIFITNILASYEKDEFYCKQNEQKGYRICRRCPKLDQNCEEPKPEEGCHCDNIAIYNKTSRNYPRLEKWHSSDVYSSEEACRPENKQINKELQ